MSRREFQTVGPYTEPGLFDMSLKNLGFLGFFKKPKKNLKSPNLGFLGF